MTSIKLPGLWLPTIKGKQYAYYRAHRAAKPIRICSLYGFPLPGDPDFLRAYQEFHEKYGLKISETTGKPVAPRSLSALILHYYAKNKRWKKLAPATSYKWGRLLREIDARYGVCNVVDLDRVGVLAIRDHFDKDTPAKANHVVVVLGVICEHAIDIGWRKDNPCAGVKRLDEDGPGYKMWTQADVDAFLAHPEIGEPLKRAVVVAAYTGLRVSDLVKLPRTARHDGVIETKTQKTGDTAWVPEHPVLTAWLNAEPARIPLPSTLLVREDGSPWPKTGIQNAMTAATKLAGLHGLSFHGLRKRLISALAEGGASDAEIGSVVPHSDQMTRYYRKAADQKKMATAAMLKISDRSA